MSSRVKEEFRQMAVLLRSVLAMLMFLMVPELANTSEITPVDSCRTLEMPSEFTTYLESDRELIRIRRGSSVSRIRHGTTKFGQTYFGILMVEVCGNALAEDFRSIGWRIDHADSISLRTTSGEISVEQAEISYRMSSESKKSGFTRTLQISAVLEESPLRNGKPTRIWAIVDFDPYTSKNAGTQ